MLHVYKIRPEWRERLSAVNHVDDTGRLQTVARDENPLYYDLIKTFDDRTGHPRDPEHELQRERADRVYARARRSIAIVRTKMDVLAIGPFFCTKGAQ